jgi:predicted nucleic acid-binding Zn ribbon protein
MVRNNRKGYHYTQNESYPCLGDDMETSKNKEFDGSKYWCKHCGKETTAVAYYSETAFGTCTVASIREGIKYDDLANFETHDSDNFDIYEYQCELCGTKESNLDKLVTTDTEEVSQVLKEREKLFKDLKKRKK